MLPPYFTDSSHCLPHGVPVYPGTITDACPPQPTWEKPVRCGTPRGIQSRFPCAPLITRLLSVPSAGFYLFFSAFCYSIKTSQAFVKDYSPFSKAYSAALPLSDKGVLLGTVLVAYVYQLLLYFISGYVRRAAKRVQRGIKISQLCIHKTEQDDRVSGKGIFLPPSGLLRVGSFPYFGL